MIKPGREPRRRGELYGDKTGLGSPRGISQRTAPEGVAARAATWQSGPPRFFRGGPQRRLTLWRPVRFRLLAPRGPALPQSGPASGSRPSSRLASTRPTSQGVHIPRAAGVLASRRAHQSVPSASAGPSFQQTRHQTVLMPELDRRRPAGPVPSRDARTPAASQIVSYHSYISPLTYYTLYSYHAGHAKR